MPASSVSMPGSGGWTAEASGMATLRNWLQTIWRRIKTAVGEFLADDCMALSASVAYYATFSLFPGLLLLISLLSSFIEGPAAQREALGVVGTYLPVPAMRDFVAQNLATTLALRGSMTIIGFVGLMWAAKGLFMGLEHGLNATWRLPRRRATLQLYLISIVLTIAVMAVVLAQFVITGVARAVLSTDTITAFGSSYDLTRFATVSNILMWAISPVVLFMLFCLLYKWLPTTRVPLRGVWQGALLATLAWKLVENAFILYSTHIVTLSAIYGPASIFLGLMLWMYLSAMSFYLGAEYSYAVLVERGELTVKAPRMSMSAVQEEV